jgi:hypothetical protein
MNKKRKTNKQIDAVHLPFLQANKTPTQILVHTARNIF